MGNSAALALEDKEFDAIRALVHSKAGIKLGSSKRALVLSRLGKRLRHHGYGSFRDYFEHLCHHDADGSELLEMINCLTTNKTEFFRESHHFDWLRERFIPELRSRAHGRGPRKVRIWSAGCSTGQEPYSIAMVLADELADDGWDVRVLASDIDTNVLAEAQTGEYAHAVTENVPDALRNKYFEASGSRLRVVRSIRDMVTFRRINFIERPWPIRAHFDAIFCRNVTIYFDRETQAVLYERLVAQLQPHGYLVAGHSENLHWLAHLLSPIGGTVYRAAAKPRTSRAPRGASRKPPPPSRAPGAVTRKPPAPSRAPPFLEVAIQSGGLHASRQPTVVRTVLGSCVAACLFDPQSRVGGMNHFMLPDGCETDWAPMRFGTHAMEALLDQLVGLGAQRSRLRAKIFGGAHVLRTRGPTRHIPEDNVAFVRRFLDDAKIPITAERVGGELPMQVRFETHSGRALVRLVADDDDVAVQDARYRDRLNAEAVQSETMRAAGRGGP